MDWLGTSGVCVCVCVCVCVWMWMYVRVCVYVRLVYVCGSIVMWNVRLA